MIATLPALDLVCTTFTDRRLKLTHYLQPYLAVSHPEKISPTTHHNYTLQIPIHTTTARGSRLGMRGRSPLFILEELACDGEAGPSLGCRSEGHMTASLPELIHLPAEVVPETLKRPAVLSEDLLCNRRRGPRLDKGVPMHVSMGLKTGTPF